MADQTIPVLNLKQANTGIAVSTASLTTSNDGVLSMANEPVVLIVSASGTCNVTVKAGHGAESKQGDVTASIGSSGGSVAIRLTSSRVKALTGADRGKARVKVSANATAYAIRV